MFNVLLTIVSRLLRKTYTWNARGARRKHAWYGNRTSNRPIYRECKRPQYSTDCVFSEHFNAKFVTIASGRCTFLGWPSFRHRLSTWVWLNPMHLDIVFDARLSMQLVLNTLTYVLHAPIKRSSFGVIVTKPNPRACRFTADHLNSIYVSFHCKGLLIRTVCHRVGWYRVSKSNETQHNLRSFVESAQLSTCWQLVVLCSCWVKTYTHPYTNTQIHIHTNTHLYTHSNSEYQT